MPNREKSTRKEWVYQLLCILLLLALLITMLATEVLRNARQVTRERAVVATYTYTDSLSGYVFRNELALQTGNNGPVEYLVSDGTQVLSGDTVARVWVDDSGSDKRERAAAIYAELAHCEAALAEYETAWQADYLSNYAALMQNASTGKLQNGAAAASKLAADLARRDAEQQQSKAVLLQRVGALRAELQTLVANVDAPETLKTALSGRFYRESDGYEATFGISAIDSLTPQTLTALLSAPQSDTQTVGKVASDGEWYLALPLTRTLADTYAVGEHYTVHIANDTVSMLLSRISYDESGNEALLILHADKAPGTPLDCRRQQVQIEKQSVSGIRIPTAAVMEENTVYIEVDGVAQSRRIRPIVQENGCLLIAFCEEDDYLHEGEEVLLSVRKIYDGKVVN